MEHGLSKRSCPIRRSKQVTRITKDQVQIVLFFGALENKRGNHYAIEVVNQVFGLMTQSPLLFMLVTTDSLMNQVGSYQDSRRLPRPKRS